MDKLFYFAKSHKEQLHNCSEWVNIAGVKVVSMFMICYTKGKSVYGAENELANGFHRLKMKPSFGL